MDTAAPGAPAITQVIDDVPGRTGALDTNETTNDTLPTLNGTGEPGSTVDDPPGRTGYWYCRC